jgi:zinc protease
LTEPKFDPKDLQRRKLNTIAGIKRVQDNPSSVADVSFNRELFPKHPYGRLISGHPDTLSQFTFEDCIRVHKVFYRPQRSLLVVSGNFNSNTQDMIRREMSQWEKWQDVETNPEEVKASSKFEIVVNKSNLEQTQIRFGHLLVPRHHPDFLKIRAANIVLGGAFASRLNQRIRDDLGLTYSIASSIDGNLLAGDFTISTFTRHDKVLEMVTEVKKVYQNFVENGVTDQELLGAKSVMIGQFPAAIETTDHLGYNLMALWAYGVSEDYLKSFQKTVSQFEKEEINRIIKQHFKLEDLSILIYTDISKTDKQIKSLGLSKIIEFKL